MKCNKLDDPEVINSLKTFDCIGLMETHADKNVDISLPGYYVFRKDRIKHKNATKPSGGIAVLVRDSMRHAYKFDPVSDSDIIWVRALKDSVSMRNDLYEGCPKSSWTPRITLCKHAGKAYQDHSYFAHYTDYLHTKFE